MDRQNLNGFAVDLGGTKIAGARIENGLVARRAVCPTNGAANLEGFLDDIAELLTGLGWHSESVVGVTVTGRVTRGGFWAPVNVETLSGIGMIDLRGALNERFGRTSVSNDAAATALAEYLFGAGRGTETFAYITVSTGIGGGLVINGKLLESSSGLAGHLGFSTVRGSDTRCGSGRTGTVESVAAGRAIAVQATQAGYPGWNAQQVFDAALDGMGWASAIRDHSAAAVSELCANLAAMIDPDLIAIGGSIGLSTDFSDLVDNYLRQEPDLFRVPLKTAELGADGPLLGALAHRLWSSKE